MAAQTRGVYLAFTRNWPVCEIVESQKRSDRRGGGRRFEQATASLQLPWEEGKVTASERELRREGSKSAVRVDQGSPIDNLKRFGAGQKRMESLWGKLKGT